MLSSENQYVSNHALKYANGGYEFVDPQAQST